MTGRARVMLPAALAGHAFAKDPGYVGTVQTVGTSGADYLDTYLQFGGSADEQFHASFNTPASGAGPGTCSRTSICTARPPTFRRR